MKLAILALLIAATAQAQPTVSDEVIWRVTSPAATFQPAPQAARIASDGVGFVVAWSEVADGISRAYAGRLDGAGRLAMIGVRTAGVADAPAVAPFGDRYAAAWLEPASLDGEPMVVIGALGRDFRLLASQPIAFADGPPVVRSTGSRAMVGVGRALSELNGEGAPVRVFDLPWPVDDLALAGEQAGYVYHGPAVSASLVCPGRPCIFPPPPPPTTPNAYSLTFTWLFRLTAGVTQPFKSDAPAALASDGSEFLVVWVDGQKGTIKGSLFGSSFAPFVISADGPLRFDKLTQPQVAWDGKRWVAVWPRGEAIEGAAITPELVVTPFHVAARGARPAVAAARSGRFIVTYEVVDTEQRRLASRFIDFGAPGRERAVR